MNDDDLLFGLDDLEGWQRGGRPERWLEERKDVLLARCQARSAMLEKLLASTDRALVARLNKRL
jgi:transposase